MLKILVRVLLLFFFFFFFLSKSFCWQWQLQDASCMEKLVTCIVQVWFFIKNNLQIWKAPFYELWPLDLAIDFQLDSVWVIGWANLYFLSLKTIESFLDWNIHPHFIFIILVDGNRFLSRMSRCIFPNILPSSIWSMQVPCAEKYQYTMMFPHPNVTAGVLGVKYSELLWHPKILI